jgi:hypothetical protein
VHALRNVHTLVVHGGTLIDLHPLTEEQIESAEGVIGTIEEPEWISETLPNAEASLREAIGARLYALEEEIEFDLRQHFDAVEDLLEAKRDLLDAQPRLVRRIHTAVPPLFTREHYVGRRLRVC